MEESNKPSGAVEKEALIPTAQVEEIRRLHQEIMDGFKTSLNKAIRAGELLLTIKRKLKHGQWLPFLAAHVGFSERAAEDYVRFYKNQEKLKSANVADLREARKLLTAIIPNSVTHPDDSGPAMRKKKKKPAKKARQGEPPKPVDELMKFERYGNSLRKISATLHTIVKTYVPVLDEYRADQFAKHHFDVAEGIKNTILIRLEKIRAALHVQTLAEQIKKDLNRPVLASDFVIAEEGKEQEAFAKVNSDENQLQ